MMDLDNIKKNLPRKHCKLISIRVNARIGRVYKPSYISMVLSGQRHNLDIMLEAAKLAKEEKEKQEAINAIAAEL